jgi:hypothetical protein
MLLAFFTYKSDLMEWAKAAFQLIGYSKSRCSGFSIQKSLQNQAHHSETYKVFKTL